MPNLHVWWGSAVERKLRQVIPDGGPTSCCQPRRPRSATVTKTCEIVSQNSGGQDCPLFAFVADIRREDSASIANPSSAIHRQRGRNANTTRRGALQEFLPGEKKSSEFFGRRFDAKDHSLFGDQRSVFRKDRGDRRVRAGSKSHVQVCCAASCRNHLRSSAPEFQEVFPTRVFGSLGFGFRDSCFGNRNCRHGSCRRFDCGSASC